MSRAQRKGGDSPDYAGGSNGGEHDGLSYLRDHTCPLPSACVICGLDKMYYCNTVSPFNVSNEVKLNHKLVRSHEQVLEPFPFPPRADRATGEMSGSGAESGPD